MLFYFRRIEQIAFSIEIRSQYKDEEEDFLNVNLFMSSLFSIFFIAPEREQEMTRKKSFCKHTSTQQRSWRIKHDGPLSSSSFHHQWEKEKKKKTVVVVGGSVVYPEKDVRSRCMHTHSPAAAAASSISVLL